MSFKLIPLNSYIRPKLIENKSKNWVLNGVNNEFYQYIIDRYNGSPTNSAIIDSYIDLMIGKGIDARNKNLTQWVEFKRVLSNGDLRKLIADFVIFNESSFHILKTKDGKGLGGLYHLPVQMTAPSLVNSDYEIDSYWFCRDFKNTYKNKPIQYPALGYEESEKEHIYKLKPYKAGKEYFADPAYLSALPYCEMEEEIANYYISHIKNGLSFGYIINIPNGKNLTEEQQDELEKKIKSKLTGSQNAGKLILSFNDSDGQAITVDVIQLNDSHKQWQYLTSESRQQIMTSHRVTSPMLFGIKDSTGLGNNANELDVAENQLYKRVIQPKQEVFLEGLKEILTFHNINLDLYFRPLTEQATSISMSVQEDDEYEFLFNLSEEEPIGYELKQIDFDLEKPLEFAATQNSEQDTDKYKVRYAYNVGTSKTAKGESRAFCNRMMALSNSGRVFRKEDIEKMSADGVNGQFAHSGGSYDIFKFAGGVNCYHRWERRIYKKREQEDGTLYGGNAMQNTKPVSVSQARREGFRPKQNDRDVAIAEIDKPNKGRYN